MDSTQHGRAAGARPRVMFIIGSLRDGSFNWVLAHYAAERLADRADVEVLAYEDVPFMNQDIEFPAPEAVSRVRAAITAADAVWIFTPEYNFSFPAPLKNLLDWMSRPLVAGDYETPRPFTAKPTTMSGAGGRGRTAGVRKHLFALLTYLEASIVGEQGEGFAIPGPVWGGAPYEIPAEDRERLDAQADALLAALK